MKIRRYADAGGATHYAVEHGGGSLERLLGDPFGPEPLRPSGEAALPARHLAPVQPRAILCIGVNYRRHAAEFGSAIPQRPVLFMKAPSAVQHPGGPIELPTALGSEAVDYEGELAVVIGRRCKNVSASEALQAVLGYTCANDVSARDWQKRPELGGGQWCRGKTFDTFAPLGPCLVTPNAIPDPNALGLRTEVNGELRQEASTSDMIFPVAELIAFLSGSTTLEPGTVILTGTPSGVGMGSDPPRWLRPGDTVSVTIEGIGTLTNPVVAEKVCLP
ncbi:fumarylacetoacetate hydrolase family protein [Cyanobium sp. FGCU-6]|jgi:2-keto-4-pentenoate hydratase/2-oxohepta-3-ene-1,7-dioic acid hydratase in catechol pathway|nr:fumarylacetoacetate hydrolase family protein [Cyanobium sp. FGCU6]